MRLLINVLFYKACIVLACIAVNPSLTLATVDLASMFRDHAVLQRDKPLPVFGTATPGERVTVAFAGQSASTVADAGGKWRVTLRPVAANAVPSTLTAAGTNTVTSQDLLVGDIWICSGQSNMFFRLDEAEDAARDMATADHPQIRQMKISLKPLDRPADRVSAKWAVCTPETAGRFTAVGYYFARQVNQTVGVPVGIVHNSWGGTAIESWTPAEVLARPEFAFVATAWRKRLGNYPAAKVKYDAAVLKRDKEVADAKAAGRVSQPRYLDEPPAPGKTHKDQPSGLFNGMVAPLTAAAVRGVIWYQGESNVGRSDEYAELFPAMIESWRAKFGQNDLPFYWAQLSGFRYSSESNNECAFLRESQAAALSLPATGQAITYDMGHATDIHPKRKQLVGHRLALIALRATYGMKDVIDSGPTVRDVAFDGSTAVVRYGHTADGLRSTTPELKGFELAGADRKFHTAMAKIQGETVVLTCNAVRSPVAVRYAFRNMPEATLTHTAGLPAGPYRSDRWPTIRRP